MRGRDWVWRRGREIVGEHGGKGTALALLGRFIPSLVAVALSLGCEAVASGRRTGVVFKDNKPQRSTGPGLVAIDGGATLEFVRVGDPNGNENGPGGRGMWGEEQTRKD